MVVTTGAGARITRHRQVSNTAAPTAGASGSRTSTTTNFCSVTLPPHNDRWRGVAHRV